jgi:hypothetical protein
MAGKIATVFALHAWIVITLSEATPLPSFFKLVRDTNSSPSPAVSAASGIVINCARVHTHVQSCTDMQSVAYFCSRSFFFILGGESKQMSPDTEHTTLGGKGVENVYL